jgi:hypothetical protein
MAVFGCHFEHERPGHPIGRDIQDIGKEFLILFYICILGVALLSVWLCVGVCTVSISL